MQENGSDYSAAMRWLGPERVSRLQQIRPGVLYNTYIDFENTPLKYGVTTMWNLRGDLREWQTLYLAGRMQKPIRLLKSDEMTEAAMRMNHLGAVRTALLFLPENFLERDLYETIAGLSYIGDSRNGFAENPAKVRNMVNRNTEGFKAKNPAGDCGGGGETHPNTDPERHRQFRSRKGRPLRSG